MTAGTSERWRRAGAGSRGPDRLPDPHWRRLSSIGPFLTGFLLYCYTALRLATAVARAATWPLRASPRWLGRTIPTLQGG